MGNNRIDDVEMERRAAALRSALGFSGTVKINGFEVLQELKRQRFLANYVILPDADLGDAAGRYAADEKVIYLSQSVAAGLRANEGRALWTIAHEVGHLALNHGTRDRKASGTQHSDVHARLNFDEVDANRFAAAFLVPESLAAVTSDTTAEHLSLRFGISLEAAERRRTELLRRYNQQQGVRRALPQGVLDFMLEASKRGLPIRPTLKSVVDQHLATKAAQYVGDPCPNPHCGELRMVRKGLITVCETCGAQTGID